MCCVHQAGSDRLSLPSAPMPLFIYFGHKVFGKRGLINLSAESFPDKVLIVIMARRKHNVEVLNWSCNKHPKSSSVHSILISFCLSDSSLSPLSHPCLGSTFPQEGCKNSLLFEHPQEILKVDCTDEVKEG